MDRQLCSSVHLLGRVPTPSSPGIGAPAVRGRRALAGAAPWGPRRSAFGDSSSPENTWQKNRVWLGSSFPACISWAGCRPPIFRGRLATVSEVRYPPGRGPSGWRARVRAESGANGWVGARGACGGRALSLSEHGLSGRGARGSGRTLNVDRARVRLGDHAEEDGVEPRIGRSASATQPALWSGMHDRAMIEPVVARGGPVGGHERLQAGWIGSGKACACDGWVGRSSEASGGIGNVTTTSRDRPPVMPITSPRPLVAPSTRRRPVPDAKVGSMVRSPQGLWRRRREDEHHRRVVRGDDRNVPDATRWGERASFEPTIAVRAEVDAKVAKCSRRRGGILKEDVVRLCRKTFGEGEGFTVHTLRRECAAFVYFRCLSPLQHILHISTCTCTCACAYVHAVRCLHNPDYDRYLSASLRYLSPLPIMNRKYMSAG